MSDLALLADQVWRVVMCTIMLAFAITEYRKGGTFWPAWCIAVALVSAASVETL